MDVIITVPHSKCVSTSDKRACDLRAAAAANIIFQRLKQLKQIRVQLVKAQTFRYEGDLNRPVTRGWAWRQHIQSMIDETIQASRHVLVIDVHSFPNSTESFVDADTGQVPHVVLLDYQNRNQNVHLPHTVVLNASKANDIIVQALQTGANAILIEFNEDTSYTTNKMINDVAEKLCKLLQKNLL